MIRRVRVRGYKSLRGVEVSLRPLSVLLGPNAAGKSNFLDALQLLSRAVTSRTLNEAFKPPYRGTALESFSLDAGGLTGQLSRKRLQFEIEVDVELSRRTVERIERQITELRRGTNGGSTTDEEESGSVRERSQPHPKGPIRERLLRYRLTIEILPESGVLRIADEYLAALRADGQLKTSRRAFLEVQKQRLHLRMEGQGHPTYHEVGLDHTLVSRPLYPPHYPHIAAFREELADWAFFYFEPRERMRALNPVKEVRHIGPMGEDLAAFLNTLRVANSAQYKAIERALHTLVPRVEGIDVQINAYGEVELKLKENGILIPAPLLSEGTLRMLGLLAVASAKEPSTLIAFEEPENGIHPRRIRLLAEFLQTRTELVGTQFIVTTHSALLPDLLPAESLFVCRRVGGDTSIQAIGDVEPLFKKSTIDGALDDSEEELRVSDFILRGDFDG